MGYTAKSVVFDFADNWRGSGELSVREIAFHFEGSEISLTSSDFTAYATTTRYSAYLPRYAFDTSLSLIGSHYPTCWMSAIYADQRLIVIFNSEQTFDSIVVNNYHSKGGSTVYGVKNCKAYVSPDSVTDTIYGNTIPNSTLIFDGVIDAHVASNVADPQVLSLVPLGDTDLTDFSLDIIAGVYFAGDITLDTSAYYQQIESCLIDISTSGSLIQDNPLDLIVAEYTFKNMPLDIQAYFVSLADINLDIHAAALVLENNKLDLFAGLQTFDDAPLHIQAALEQMKNTLLDISIVDGIVTGNTSIDISVNDGNKTQSMGMNLLAVSTMPEFKSVYTLNLNSAIKEI